MAIRFELEQLIATSPDRVYAALTELNGLRSWVPQLARVERISGDAAAPGSRWRETRRSDGREAVEEVEVIVAEPPHRLVLRVDGRMGSVRRGQYLFEYAIEPLFQANGGTRLLLRGQITGFGPVFGLLARLFLGSFRKSCATDLRALAAHLAARSTVSA